MGRVSLRIGMNKGERQAERIEGDLEVKRALKNLQFLAEKIGGCPASFGVCNLYAGEGTQGKVRNKHQGTEYSPGPTCIWMV